MAYRGRTAFPIEERGEDGLSVLEYTAIQMMKALIINGGVPHHKSFNDIAEDAVDCAKALLKRVNA